MQSENPTMAENRAGSNSPDEQGSGVDAEK